MGEFSISHVLILTLILLIFFGPSRLPALGQSIGKAIRGFKDGMNETEKEINTSLNQEPTNTPLSGSVVDIAKQEDKSHQNKS